MLSSDRGRVVALGGLIAILACFALGATFWYALPEEPRATHEAAAKAPEVDYQPGGTSCRPANLKALPAGKAQAERDRCAAARVQYHNEQQSTAEAARANDVAERNLAVAADAARITFAQTVATVFAFIAAAVASGVAWRAVHWARKAAEHTETAAGAAREQLEAVKVAERAYIVMHLELKPTLLGLEVLCANSGRTYCNIHSVYYVVRTKLPAWQKIRTLRFARIETDRDMMPTAGSSIALIPGPIPDNAQHVLGYARYRDVYRGWHRQYFRYDRNPGNSWKVGGGQSWNSSETELQPDHLGASLPVT